MAGHRMDRISEEIKRELYEVIKTLKDPRIPEFITVVAVKVSKDLKYAKAYISTLESEPQKQKEILQGLKSSSGFIRHELKQRLLLRYTPEFTFVIDESIKQGAHINDILHDLDGN